MMYRALYRQYRPKTFDEVLGQKHITTTLKNQVQKNNIGHAYLFSGTRGTGKTSTAKILSRAVNCIDLQSGNPCNRCEMCRGILDESIMDIIEMDAASNRRIDDIRDLREKVVYPPSRTKYKVYIIDEVHMLTQEAFNALLKTLEEPPKHLIFILATTEPEKLPQTILSRCQRFDFKRVSTNDMVDKMVSISEDLKFEVDGKVLNLIARNSDGAMRDALSLLDQCISFDGEKIAYEDAINILGIVNNDKILDLIDSIISKNLKASLSLVDNIIQDGKDMNQFIKDTIYHFRNIMVAKSTKNPSELIELDEETLNRYIGQASKIQLEFILDSLDILTMADEKAKWSTQPRVILEMAIIQIVNLEQELSLEERVERLEKGNISKPEKSKKQTIEEPIRERAKVSTEDKTIKKKEEKFKKQSNEYAQGEERQDIPQNQDSLNLDISVVKSRWKEILQRIKKEKMNVYALLIEGKPSELQNGLLTITYKEPYGFHKEAINSPQNKEFVEKTLSDYFKVKLEINLAMEREGKGNGEDEKKKKDNSIKAVIDFFGEDLVEVE